jgi:hypothetical protein
VALGYDEGSIMIKELQNLNVQMATMAEIISSNSNM